VTPMGVVICGVLLGLLLYAVFSRAGF